MIILAKDHPELIDLWGEIVPSDPSSVKGIYVNSGKCWWLFSEDLHYPPEGILWNISDRVAHNSARVDSYKKILQFLKENYPEALI